MRERENDQEYRQFSEQTWTGILVSWLSHFVVVGLKSEASSLQR